MNTILEPRRSHLSFTSGTKPISPRTHGLIDYGQSVMLAAAPALLGLTGSTSLLTRLFGFVQAGTNAFTDTGVGMRRMIPFPVHGQMEKWIGPAFLGLALLTGGGRKRRNLGFLLGQTLLSVMIFRMTDWAGDPDR